MYGLMLVPFKAEACCLQAEACSLQAEALPFMLTHYHHAALLPVRLPVT
jgi:hypothetical protein